jgi:hypothetical protein
LFATADILDSVALFAAVAGAAFCATAVARAGDALLAAIADAACRATAIAGANSGRLTAVADGICRRDGPGGQNAGQHDDQSNRNNFRYFGTTHGHFSLMKWWTTFEEESLSGHAAAQEKLRARHLPGHQNSNRHNAMQRCDAETYAGRKSTTRVGWTLTAVSAARQWSHGANAQTSSV